ncbi:hypothetical protein Tco_0744717 [Tanacetum coccineum]
MLISTHAKEQAKAYRAIRSRAFVDWLNEPLDNDLTSFHIVARNKKCVHIAKCNHGQSMLSPFMSSASSAVTYTSVYTDSEPGRVFWGADEEISDGGPTPEADTWDEIVEAMMEITPTTLEGVDQRVTELDTTVRQRTEEDRPYHRHTALALDREVVYARIVWTGSEERSAAIEAHVRTLEARDPEPQDGPAEAGSSC